MNDSEKLIQKYLDDVATDADVANLHALLRQRPDIADHFIDLSLLDTELARHFSQEAIETLLRGISIEGKTPFDADDATAELGAGALATDDSGALLLDAQQHQNENASPLRRLGKHKWWIGAAAAFAISAAGVYIHSLNNAANVPVAVRHPAGTTVPSGPDSDGSLHIAGDSGDVIQLSDGTRVELAPSAVAIIRDGDRFPNRSVELQQGRGTFEIAPQHAPFEVITAVGRVAALGTKFTVALSPANPRGQVPIPGRDTGTPAMYVNVTGGTVQVTTGGQKQKLTIGQSRVFGQDGSAWTPIPAAARVSPDSAKPLKIAFYDYPDQLVKGIDSLEDAKSFVQRSKPDVEYTLGASSIDCPRDNPRTVDPRKVSLGDYLLGAAEFKNRSSAPGAANDPTLVRMAQPITTRTVTVFTGFIAVSTAGTYDLVVEADDGDEFTIGGVNVHAKTEFGGMTNLTDPRYAARATFVEPGVYPIQILHWDREGELGIHVYCELDPTAELSDGHRLMPVVNSERSK